MFGYVTINRQELKVRELEAYEAYYCGLCMELRKRHGMTAAMALNYDMTFLGILHSSLYEDAERYEGLKCAVCHGHPGQSRAVTTESLGYAADMNYMIAFYAHADNWRDEHRLSSLNMLHIMHKKYEALAKKYPRQHRALQTYVKKLHALEAADEQNIEAAAALTGDAMAAIYVRQSDMWEEALSQMGRSMGKFIYLMDAYDDVEKDVKAGNYNPLKAIYGNADFETKVEEYLRLIMSRCCRAFETLPVIENAELMRNILYAGVWVRYAQITSKRHDRQKVKEDNDRSIQGTGSIKGSN